MKKIIFALFCIISIHVSAQVSGNAGSIVVFSSGGAMSFMEVKSKPSTTVGSVYYNDEWNYGDIYLFSGESIQNYWLKYDLKNQKIEIKVDTSIKVINIAAVKQIEWFDKSHSKKIFINCAEFPNAPNKLGIFELMSEGKIKLLKKTVLDVLESNYNPVMNVGNKDSKYFKKTQYFVDYNDKFREIRKGKRPILKLMAEKSKEVENFARLQNLSYKKDSDLEQIFNYYNSL